MSKLKGGYQAEYRVEHISRRPSYDYPSEKQIELVLDSNGVIVGIKKEQATFCSGGADEFMIESTPYMSHSVRIFRKKGIQINALFMSYENGISVLANYFGRAEISGDTLITTLRKDLSSRPLKVGEKVPLSDPFVVKYLLDYDSFDEQYRLYYFASQNRADSVDSLLWQKDVILRKEVNQ